MFRFALFAVICFAFSLNLNYCHAQTKISGPKPWVVTKSEDAPRGMSYTFHDNGKMSVSMKIEGKAIELEGTYVLKGDELTMTFKSGGKDRVDVRKVLSLSDTKIILEDKNKKKEEFER